MYTVVESAGSVEVCVNLTYPPDDIFEERVTLLVFHNDSSIYVPPNPTFASKQLITIIYKRIGYRDDTMPTLQGMVACNNLCNPQKLRRREEVAEDHCMLSNIPCSPFLYLQFLVQCHP